MIRKLAVPAALALALVTTVTGAWAWGPGGFGGPGARLERALEQLQLDEAKRTEVFGVIDAARPAERTLGEQLGAARQELRTLLANPEAGEDAVLAKADEIGALATELRKHELRTLLQVRARLSAEQQAQLAEAMTHGHCDRGGRHDRGLVL